MPEPLYLYNEQFLFWPRCKQWLKSLLKRGLRGPYEVENSLHRGLRQLGIAYLVNSNFKQPVEVACVLSGVKTLRWAISQKNHGRIKRLVAGPNIAMPNEAGGIIFDPAIDFFLVPSVWVADFCDFYNPGFKTKVRVWAAGVATLPAALPLSQRQGCLVYKKNVDEQVLQDVLSVLKSQKISYTVVRYGSYNKPDYYRQLSKTKFLIYLSKSESQGIALNEAWMMNVPTLIWNGGHLQSHDYDYQYSSPSPYLNDQSGMFFSNIKELPDKLKEFSAKLNSFRPRDYHLQNFTDEAAAKNFLKIIQESS